MMYNHSYSNQKSWVKYMHVVHDRLAMESSAGQATLRAALELGPRLISKLMSKSLVRFLSICSAHCTACLHSILLERH